MTLRQASNELTKALGKFVNFVYKKSPDYNNAMTIDELWSHLDYNPEGVGNISEDALALIDYVKERNSTSSFDELYGGQRSDVVASQVGEFLDAVQSMVEGKASETRYMADAEDPFFVDLSSEELKNFPGDLEYQLDLTVSPRLRTAFNEMLPTITSDATNGRLKSYYANGSMSVKIYGYGDYYFDVLDQEDNDYETVRQAHLDFNRRSGKRRGGREYDGWNDKGPGQERNQSTRGPGQPIQNGPSVQRRGDSEGYDGYVQSAPTWIESTLSRIDDDYMPLAERYAAGLYTNADIDKMRELVDEAAYAAGLPSAQYALVVYDEDGNVVPLAERAARVARFSLDDDLIEQYGAIEQGREPRARDVVLPKQSADNMRVSKLTRSIEESSKVTNAQAAEIV